LSSSNESDDSYMSDKSDNEQHDHDEIPALGNDSNNPNGNVDGYGNGYGNGDGYGDDNGYDNLSDNGNDDYYANQDSNDNQNPYSYGFGNYSSNANPDPNANPNDNSVDSNPLSRLPRLRNPMSLLGAAMAFNDVMNAGANPDPNPNPNPNPNVPNMGNLNGINLLDILSGYGMMPQLDMNGYGNSGYNDNYNGNDDDDNDFPLNLEQPNWSDPAVKALRSRATGTEFYDFMNRQGVNHQRSSTFRRFLKMFETYYVLTAQGSMSQDDFLRYSGRLWVHTNRYILMN